MDVRRISGGYRRTGVRIAWIGIKAPKINDVLPIIKGESPIFKGVLPTIKKELMIGDIPSIIGDTILMICDTHSMHSLPICTILHLYRKNSMSTQKVLKTSQRQFGLFWEHS